MSTTSNDDLLQNSLYVGINLEDILYGIELVLYFKTMYILLGHPGKRTRSGVFYAIFSSVMLMMVTIWVAMQAIFGQKMWVLDADFPNGPEGFFIANIASWYMDMASMSLIMLQLMTDALMVYRCWMLWNSYCVIIMPVILWAGSLVLGVLVGWASAVSGGFYFHYNVVQLGLACYTISVFLTVMLTCMICYRLVRYGRLMKEHLGREYASTYFAVLALVIESALPYTLSGIAFLISLGVGSQMVMAFGYIYALMMCISPQMLILRVAVGVSTNSTSLKQPPSMIKFSPLEAAVLGTSEGSNVLCVESRKHNDSMV